MVEERGNPAGLRRAPTGEEMCHGREREATKGLRYDCSSFSPLYIGPRERGRAQPCPLLQGRGAAKDGEESILPKAPRRCLPPLGLSPFSFILAHGPLGAGALGPCRPRRTPYSQCAPPGQVAPPGGPGTIPMTPKLVPMAETGLPIYKSLPPDHSGTPRDVRDLIRDSEQHSVTTYKLPL